MYMYTFLPFVLGGAPQLLLLNLKVALDPRAIVCIVEADVRVQLVYTIHVRIGLCISGDSCMTVECRKTVRRGGSGI
jgi:hypothetical protein